MTRSLTCAAVMLALTTALLASNSSPQQRAMTDATDAWTRGEYIAALNGYIKLLNDAGGEAFHDAIALQTGELHRSIELTRDGRNPRFSPDARHLSYETGLEVSRRTKIVRNDDTLTPVADLSGISATFSPAGNAVAYLKIVETPELLAAVKVVDAAPLAGQNRNALIQALTYQVLRSSAIVIRDLATQQERELAAPGLMKTALTYGADGRTLYFLGGVEGDAARNDIYSIAEGGQPTRLGDADGLKGTPIVADGAVLYAVSGQNPFRPPQPPGGGGRGGGAGAPAQGRGPVIGVIDLATNKTRAIEGAAPTLSADSKSLAYIGRSGADYQLLAGPVLGQHAVVKKTSERLDAPALSPDGSRVAYQAMARDDWEVFIAQRDGSNESRLTRDNQHDVLPRFIASDRLVVVVGEARHRRSFLYNLGTGERVRLFHNNTVRTIAPEYQWAVSADGTRMLVGAERDGDTVSPERGVYLLRLDQKISKPELLKRLSDNLASETALHASAKKSFGAIAADVKNVLDPVSVARIYGYEKALFDFDSKHISRPGNKRAAEYLFEDVQVLRIRT